MSGRSVIDILLQTEIPNSQTKRLKMKRLSQLAGEDVFVTLKELPYDRIAELRKFNGSDPEFEIHNVLASMVDPDMKNPELQAKYGVITPADLVKKLFKPGEIAELSLQVERLCGYRSRSLEEVEKK